MPLLNNRFFRSLADMLPKVSRPVQTVGDIRQDLKGQIARTRVDRIASVGDRKYVVDVNGTYYRVVP